MGAENDENIKQAFADWQAAYARLTQKATNGSDGPPPGDAIVFALRALLHPALRPFLIDPTLSIGETYPALDEYARVLLETATGGQAAAAYLGRDDTAALIDAGLLDQADVPTIAEIPLASDSANTAAAVGAIWGSLYLPARQAAVPCRVRAAWADAPLAHSSGWPAPRPLRAVSEELENAGRTALAAALAALRQGASGLPARLQPAALVWDVCLPGEPDILAQNAQGDSLQLPLALAFLSLLTDTPLPGCVSATGALAASIPAGENDCGVAVRPVGFTQEKARSLAFLGPRFRFLVPAAAAPSESAEAGVSATRIPVHGLAEAFARAVQTSETAAKTPLLAYALREQTDTGTARAIACYLFAPNGNAVQKERETLTRRILTRFSHSIDTTRDAHGGTVLFVHYAAWDAALSATLAVRQNLYCFMPWPLPAAYFAETATEKTGSRAHPRVGIVVEPLHGANGFLWETHAKPRAEAVARAAAPGQTLLDGAEHAETDDAQGRETAYCFHLLGRFRLLNLAPPVALHGVYFQNEPPPPLPAGEKPGGALLDAFGSHNLPTESAPLIGRDAELNRLLGLLTGKFPARIVTLTGGSGVGKTRLALETAARAAPFFAGGVWLAPVGGVQSEDDLAARIADAMELRLHLASEGGSRTGPPDGTLTDQVVRRLQQIGAPVLLILDNAEAALDAVAAFLAKIPQQSAPITCLVTSPEPLGAPGEVPVPVQPLDIPLAPAFAGASGAGEDEQSARAAVLQSPAGAFFLSRAGRAPQTGEWRLALSVCRALRGVPLALLLVAAQTPFLDYDQIAPQFAPHLAGSPPTGLASSAAAPASVVRSAFRSVYGLLSWSEQTLLRRIAPLLISDRESISGGASRAGWTREAALAVSQMDTHDASDALVGLQSRGLISRHSFQNRAYFTCLPVIAEWAQNLLEGSQSENKAALDAHARFFLRLAHEKAHFWDTPDETRAFDELHTQRHQLRAVAATLQETDPVAFLQFVADVGSFLRYRGMVREWRDWPRRAVRIIEMGGDALEAVPTVEAALCFARLYQFCAINALDSGDALGALTYAQTGLPIARKAAHRIDSADLLNLRAIARGQLGQTDLALADWREARALFEETGNKRGLVTVLNSQGKFWEARKEWDAARACHEEQLEICRRIQDTRGLCYALGNLGCNAFVRRSASESRVCFTQQLALARELKDAESVAAALINLGDVLDTLCHDPGPAVPLLALGEQIYAKIHHPHEKEAASYLARIAPLYGQANIDLWRRDFARRTLADLVVYPLQPPHHLVLPTDAEGKTGFLLPSPQNADENRGSRAEDG